MSFYSTVLICIMIVIVIPTEEGKDVQTVDYVCVFVYVYVYMLTKFS